MNLYLETLLFINIFVTILLILIITFNYNINSKEFIKNLIENNTNIKIIENSSPINDFDIIVTNNDFYKKVLQNGELGLGESYMDGDWFSNNLQSTLLILIKNQVKIENEIKNKSFNFCLFNLKIFLRSLLPSNTIVSSRKNISMHYDIGNDLYIKMLDKNMQYTCAYYYKPNMTLDEAQEAKLHLIAKKINLQKGERVLDIGCGFGTAAAFFAKNYEVTVVGVTLSKEQVNYFKEHVNNPNVEIRNQDYRLLNKSEDGMFDKIYSIGCFEHLGIKGHHLFYDKCYELLKNNGTMLLHTISGADRYNPQSPWINKYIFPEVDIPHVCYFTKPNSDKWQLQDYQNIGMSYAKTLQAWSDNIGNWEDLENYDSRFKNMWKFYLDSCIAAFKARKIHLSQCVYFKYTTDLDNDPYYIRESA